ncbi:WXG100 family type VII secretion target [Streptomyces sp. NPDC059849]|uniref:WXG100 family type VII secretion target n=1 Tax=Streptomyces sp. NPDC059849 TaxID=3346969 RepID=UPI0036694425
MGTDFDKKTHEQMLEWLDRANSGEMQAASDRLAKAASEISKVAEDLKIRPQWVEWKGQGADAFRTWSADLANATLRLGDYSEGVSKWLGEASNAIALAQASIPRTEAGALANLEAAHAARNDPDASDVARKSAETLIESGKRNRDEAAAQMRRLSQAYTFSSSQMTSLEKPVFPTLPKAISLQGADMRGGRQNGELSPGPAPASASSGAVPPGVSGHRAEVTADVTAPDGSVTTTPYTMSPSVSGSVDMGIDGVAALPETLPAPVTNPVVPPTGPRPDSLPLPTPGMIPPVPPISPSAPHSTSGGGRTTGLPRPSVSAPGATPPGPGPVGRAPGPNGITGGRVVPPETGHSAVGIPRGTVIGNENPRGTAPMGRAPGMGGGIGSGASPITGSSRRLAGEPGGVMGSRQQQGRGSAHPFTAGGSGLVRGGASGGPTRKSSGARMTGRDGNGERPDHLVEDDETWQQGGRRVVPPVID